MQIVLQKIQLLAPEKQRQIFGPIGFVVRLFGEWGKCVAFGGENQVMGGGGEDLG